MGEVKKLDQMMNDAGYLRLMVSEPLTMNMSNSVPQNLRQGNPQNRKKIGRTTWRKFANSSLIRKPLLKLYDFIFRLYYEN